MGYKLCMAEKPSVAKDIANVIGADKRFNGYFEGSGYRVTWAVGHLVGLAEPEAYGYVTQRDMWGDDAAMKARAYDELPLIPDQFKLIVLEPTKDQFEIVKRLINDPECDEIINCGDMGPEGHILQWFIRTKAGCTKKVRRFCATSMTDEAIRSAMANLRPEEDFANIIKGEFCKKKADWIMGMSMSRAASLKYSAGINVGRVQSPTLYFVVKRYLDVKNFKVTNYYAMDAQLAEGFHVFWNVDKDNVFGASLKDSSGRVLDKAAVESRCSQIEKGRTGEITNVAKEKKGLNSPQLYDILELQREANRKYGYTAALTLATAQALYETQKILSYPRTDSRYITSDLKAYMPERLRAIATLGRYTAAVENLLSAGLNIDKHIVDDTKVTDHHALIVTEKIENFHVDEMEPTKDEKKKGVTAESMRNILDLVICRMIVCFCTPYRYENTDVTVRFPCGITFTASGQKVIDLGWKAMQERLSGKEQKEKNEEADAEQIFPDVQKGQIVTVRKCTIVPKKTTPPKYHTEDTLLSSMKNAGANVENGKILAGKGIGTQATRAEIIKKLFDTGYVTTLTKGKTNYIVPTIKGQTIIRVLPPELYSPKITADWETRIALIAENKMTEKQFMDEFTAFIHQKVHWMKETETGIDFKKQKEAVGTCPWCGKELYRYEDKEKGSVRYYCSNKDACTFGLDTMNPIVTTRIGKKMTENQLKRLIANKSITLSCKGKYGGEYKGKFTIVKGEYQGRVCANIEFSFVKSASVKK